MLTYNNKEKRYIGPIMVEMIQDPIFSRFPNVKHGFFTRYGGVSAGCYASLNCCYAGNDDATKVTENRRRAMEVFGYPLESLVSTKNVHGDQVAIVDNDWDNNQKPMADGIL